MKSRFDLESDIHSCWNLLEDMDTVIDGVLEYDMNQDQISNMLIGLKQIYEIRFII